MPGSQEEIATLLDIYILERELYGLGYELDNRPDWVHIALVSLLHVLSEEEPAGLSDA